jgi:hypothetical protein
MFTYAVSNMSIQDLTPDLRRILLNAWRWNTILSCPDDIKEHHLNVLVQCLYELPPIYGIMPPDNCKSVDRLLSKLPFINRFRNREYGLRLTTPQYDNTRKTCRIEDLARLLGAIALNTESLILNISGNCIQIGTIETSCMSTFPISRISEVFWCISESPVEELIIEASSLIFSDHLGEFLRRAKKIHALGICIVLKDLNNIPDTYSRSVSPAARRIQAVSEYSIEFSMYSSEFRNLDSCFKTHHGMITGVLDAVFTNRTVSNVYIDSCDCYAYVFRKYGSTSGVITFPQTAPVHLLTELCTSLGSMDRISITIPTGKDTVKLSTLLATVSVTELAVDWYLNRNFPDIEIEICRIVHNPSIHTLVLMISEYLRPNQLTQILEHVKASTLTSLTMNFSAEMTFSEIFGNSHGTPDLFSCICKILFLTRLEEFRIICGIAPSAPYFVGREEEVVLFCDLLRTHPTLQRICLPIHFSDRNLQRVVNAFASNRNLLELSIHFRDIEQIAGESCANLLVAHATHWKDHCKKFRQAVGLVMQAYAGQSGMRCLYDTNLLNSVVLYTKMGWYGATSPS